MKRDRFRCTYCGIPGTDAELEIDHIIAIAKGGSNHISNLTTACRSCNQAKGSGAAPKRAPAPAAKSPSNPSLLVQAEIVQLVYYPHRCVLEIYLADGDCTDMSGAIELARRIDPEIDRIRTFSGDKPDTYYNFEGVEWVAFDSRLSVVK
jgi:hypothetical protein